MILHSDALPEDDIWEQVRTTWWFDDQYLKFDLSSISAFFLLADEYRQLPRHRGSGHKIEEWVKNHEIIEPHLLCNEALESLLMTKQGGEQ